MTNYRCVASATRQLEWAHSMWPKITLPKPPVIFKPLTDTEVLLLHMANLTPRRHWNSIVPPAGYTKEKWCALSLRGDRFRATAGALKYEKKPKPTWVAFDPEYGRDISPRELQIRHASDEQGELGLAGEEVFSALFQFPEWSLTWLKGASAPYMSGCKYRRPQYDTGTSDGWLVPYFALLTYTDPPRLQLDAAAPGNRYEGSASPSVRMV